MKSDKSAVAVVLVVGFLLAGDVAARAASVTVAWDPNTEPDVTRYVVSWGVRPSTYTGTVAAGLSTSVVVPNLTDGTRYYFAVQACSATGCSDYSAEVSTLVGASAVLPTSFDGDSATDIAVFRPSTGLWYVRKSTGGFTTTSTTYWGAPTDIPVQGDFDGDGVRIWPCIGRPTGRGTG